MVLHLMDKICMAFEVCLPFILYVRSALIYIGIFSIEEDNWFEHCYWFIPS